MIAPDSSHWIKWIDATRAPDINRRKLALDFHDRLVSSGRIVLLTWHHIEELLGGKDDDSARERIDFLKRLPLVAWMRWPNADFGFASIAQILAAEAIAASEGHNTLISIRDRARELLIQTGSGRDAIGEESWVYEAIRPLLHDQQAHTDLVAALSHVRIFDENRSIGQLCKLKMHSPAEANAQLQKINLRIFSESLQSNGGDMVKAKVMTEAFMDRLIPQLPPPGTTVRELLVASLVSQGLDEDEIRDDCILAELSRLAVFRSQLRAIASETGRSFEELKRVPMEKLPSQLIGAALKAHGQTRSKRPGSDVNDSYLAVLAAYCDVVYVDKRTAEDFKRAIRKERKLSGLIGNIARAADFLDLLDPAHIGRRGDVLREICRKGY